MARVLAANGAYVTEEEIAKVVAFWAKQARERLTWIKPFTKVKDTSFDANDLHVRWFADGQLNVSANCLDRHLMKRPDQTAILWEPDDPNEPGRMLSYRELHDASVAAARQLQALGLRAGDRLLVAGLIEARSCERFDLLRRHVADRELADAQPAAIVERALREFGRVKRGWIGVSLIAGGLMLVAAA